MPADAPQNGFCQKFLDWTHSLRGHTLLFRGIANAKDWKDAEASIVRRLPEMADQTLSANVKRETFIMANKLLLKEAVMKGHNKHKGANMGALELLAELQHYGAATCLIDWTKNPLIALWFASSEPSEEDGKIVAFDAGADNTIDIEPHHLDWRIDKFENLFSQEENGGKIWTWEPTHQNPRITAQQSVFTFGDPEITIPKGYERPVLQNDKKLILEELRKCGISESTMFPDFDGFARKLNAHDKGPLLSARDYIAAAQTHYKNKNYDLAEHFSRLGIGGE